MKKAKPITREQLLALRPPKGELTEREFMETAVGKKVADAMLRHIESRRLLRSELTDGDDDSYKVSYMMMADIIGKTPLDIEQMESKEVDEWLAAIIRKKRRESKLSKPSVTPAKFVAKIKARFAELKIGKSHSEAGKAMAAKLSDADWELYKSGSRGKPITLTKQAYFTGLSKRKT